MKTRIFTYVECSCGHRGALIETIETGAFRAGGHQARLRKLTHAGTYDGENVLFAAMKPGCPACCRSLSPDDVVGRSQLQGTGEVLRLARESESADVTLGARG
ncbi:hypothetical protein LMG27177_03843 [Paraburkholderia fynbosensis]|uniref:Uncharacterized protein n=1 Tax=Paraburkholderia fynbosensis TaxID=1200993 RepID=A0A6J5GB21_9BURK|nr:hypothetical protein LMG27177_03843 [Paraburkholderia fynbosensis]